MSLISAATKSSIENSSWIRRMFEAGFALKQEHGEDAVCDFSIGNPDLPPPPQIATGLRALAEKAHLPFALGYMPNGGYPWAREALAKHLCNEQGINISASNVVLTCGAAGGLNAFFKTTLEPQDEVIALAPYFVEYGFYVANHQGVFRTVQTKADTFELDIPKIAAALNEKTRAIIINSPNNPTGQIYTKEELTELASVLLAASEKFGRPIFLIADEPYRFLAFDNIEVPSVLPLYPYAVVASSFSKNLSMPGERIGYLALSPLMPNSQPLTDGLFVSNRILGFVNPPAIGQHLMCAALGSGVDMKIYEKRRNCMAEVLHQAGYEFLNPKGAFYFFPKAPGGDDVKFVQTLMKHLILAVPGSGFGAPGYFRLTFCLDEKIILRSLEGFKKAMAEFK